MYQDDHCATRRIIFTYPMIAYTDMEDGVKTEVMEIATNACEKYLNDNQSVIIFENQKNNFQVSFSRQHKWSKKLLTRGLEPPGMW